MVVTNIIFPQSISASGQNGLPSSCNTVIYTLEISNEKDCTLWNLCFLGNEHALPASVLLVSCAQDNQQLQSKDWLRGLMDI